MYIYVCLVGILRVIFIHKTLIPPLAEPRGDVRVHVRGGLQQPLQPPARVGGPPAPRHQANHSGVHHILYIAIVAFSRETKLV